MAKAKFLKVISQWPVVVIALGVALSFLWICVLAWLPLHLLNVI